MHYASLQINQNFTYKHLFLYFCSTLQLVSASLKNSVYASAIFAYNSSSLPQSLSNTSFYFCFEGYAISLFVFFILKYIPFSA